MTENAQAAQPVFSIEKLYVKDLSLEVPNAPKIFLDRENPQINVQLRTEASNVDEGVFEVTLTVTVSSKLPEDRTVFLVEVAQAGIFQIRNIPEGDLEAVMMIGCPNILFPYARESVSDAITRAGFQPVVLAPVNFESLYQAQQQQQAAAAAQAGELPIQ
ncbi:protein-export chaperone SecB [Aromatoleum aromaticum]|uniref:Protein-export protein SecB n=1 Tax=Aromatoleum aromaticum (strain DSM 19018 / LMG 30748 / EbN1) TaxID=76114 RepID=SECB_AROAE|nr:protein-export chaperone SecB [Aromatoleum aromaticum]Q5P7N1.1 RecName: Full=Protein-export protein SecB [Aromatoleum aromaticum EbN1]NMG53113.1 protein-export chaperone SecB [Aromatoleum aromaticum]CAI06680.1 protein-export protein [Aromatoleum aromaticum EbN1]